MTGVWAVSAISPARYCLPIGLALLYFYWSPNCIGILLISIVDGFRFVADPDPAFHFDGDSDPGSGS
jgi:hypothetical protein